MSAETIQRIDRVVSRDAPEEFMSLVPLLVDFASRSAQQHDELNRSLDMMTITPNEKGNANRGNPTE
jgi:hypothetical protein